MAIALLTKHVVQVKKQPTPHLHVYVVAGQGPNVRLETLLIRCCPELSVILQLVHVTYSCLAFCSFRDGTG